MKKKQCMTEDLTTLREYVLDNVFSKLDYSQVQAIKSKL